METSGPLRDALIARARRARSASAWSAILSIGRPGRSLQVLGSLRCSSGGDVVAPGGFGSADNLLFWDKVFQLVDKGPSGVATLIFADGVISAR